MAGTGVVSLNTVAFTLDNKVTLKILYQLEQKTLNMKLTSLECLSLGLKCSCSKIPVVVLLLFYMVCIQVLE